MATNARKPVRFKNLTRPRNSSFPPKQREIQPVHPDKQTRGHFVEITGDNGEAKKLFVRPDDLGQEEAWERVQHRYRQLKDTHAVYEWSKYDRVKMENIIDNVILRLRDKKPLTRSQMDFAKTIEMPASYIPPHLRTEAQVNDDDGVDDAEFWRNTLPTLPSTFNV